MTVIQILDTIQYDTDVEVEVWHGRFKYASTYYEDLVDGYVLKCAPEYEGLQDQINMLKVKRITVTETDGEAPILITVEV